MTDILSTISRCRSLLSEGGILFYDAFCVFCFSFFFFWRDCSATAAFISTKSSPTNGRLCSVIRWWWYPTIIGPQFFWGPKTSIFGAKIYTPRLRGNEEEFWENENNWCDYNIRATLVHTFGDIEPQGAHGASLDRQYVENGNTYSSEVHKQLKVWPFRPCSPFGDFPPVS